MILLFALACTERPAPEPQDLTTPPGSTSADPTTPWVVETEWVPGDTGPLPPPGLCTMDLQCSQAIPDEPKVPCAFQVWDEHGGTHYDGYAGVELRGRSSLGFPKHQYAIELWDDTGADAPTNLLGMGADADWVVNGAYIDRGMIRNKLGYDLFVSWGGTNWAAESASCTLTLNGQAQGIYFLTEKVKRDDDRLDLAEDPTLSGASFVVKLEDSGGIVDNTPVGYGTWRLVYPNPATAAQSEIDGVAGALLGWQGALLGPDPAAIFDHVDLESAVDFVLLEELVKNNDAYFLSIHLWRDAGGPIRFTPWDLDLSIGQPTYNDNVPPEGWVLSRPTMIARMRDDPAFQARLGERWRELRATSLTDAALLARVDEHRADLGDVLYENYQIWDWSTIYAYWGTLPIVSGPDQEYANIRAWLPARTAWIDANVDTW